MSSEAYLQVCVTPSHIKHNNTSTTTNNSGRILYFIVKRNKIEMICGKLLSVVKQRLATSKLLSSAPVAELKDKSLTSTTSTTVHNVPVVWKRKPIIKNDKQSPLLDTSDLLATGDIESVLLSYPPLFFFFIIIFYIYYIL